LEGEEDTMVGSGGGSVEDSSEGMDRDSDDEEEEEEEGDPEDVRMEMTDENKMEKKKLFDDMIGRSLSFENGKNRENNDKVVGSKSGGDGVSITSGHSGSAEGNQGAGQAALRRVLRAYSVYDSEVVSLENSQLLWL
jgi:hypothetical protein